MTKAERKEETERGLYCFMVDECRVQIAEAQWHRAHVLKALEGSIKFFDAKGRYWASTEPYTLVVTKEVNSDDEEADSGKLD